MHQQPTRSDETPRCRDAHPIGHHQGGGETQTKAHKQGTEHSINNSCSQRLRSVWSKRLHGNVPYPQLDAFE
jgi:hypothetical protein